MNKPAKGFSDLKGKGKKNKKVATITYNKKDLTIYKCKLKHHHYSELARGICDKGAEKYLAIQQAQANRMVGP